jgi:penicillin G amidase
MRTIRLTVICCVLGVAALSTECLNVAATEPVPPNEGPVAIPGLTAEVRVVRDANGVPHIFARNEDDASIALGYVHARDRLWQMDMMRHLAEGRLAELVGLRDLDDPLLGKKTTVDLDVYNRVLGFKYLAEKDVERLDAYSRKVLALYASGINAYADRNADRVPVEFTFLGVRFEPWEPRDTAAIYIYVAWSLNNDWAGEALRYAVAAERGEKKAWELVPLHVDPGPFILEEYESFRTSSGKASVPREAPGTKGTSTPEAKPISDSNSRGIAELLSLGRLVDELRLSLGFEAASNNWVVSGARTTTGKPILCNDPHLPLTAPSIWYQIHVSRPGMDVIGAMIPGTPAIGIGRNRRIAWGVTTPYEDTMDLFVERVNPENPDEYLYKGNYRSFSVRTERICCRDGNTMKSIDTLVRMTVHGPIVNDVVPSLKKSKELLALKWTAYDFDFRPKGLQMLKLGEAGNWDEFRRCIDIGIPLFNWVYADAEGNIGYVAPGLIPRRAAGDGTYPAPGWTGEYDWQGYVPLEQMPSVYNPPRGFVVTANNQVFPEGALPYTFSKRYMPSYRAARIRQLLLEKDKLDVEDMKRIQSDVYSKQGERLARFFVAAGERSEESNDPVSSRALEALRAWDFRLTVESVGATVFHVVYQFAFENILKDEMSEAVFRVYEDDFTIDTAFDNLLEKEQSDLFDDRSTERIETKQEILARSMKDAIAFLKKEFGRDVQSWMWGKAHTVTMEHMALGKVPVLKEMFNVGPFPMPGGRHTVNNATYLLSDRAPIATFVGSSFREINDMSKPGEMLDIIPLGASGISSSTHYRDQTRKWLNGEYNLLSMDPEEIRKGAEEELVLRPAGRLK